MTVESMPPDEREKTIRGLCAMAKWADWNARRPWRDFDSEPGRCPAVTTALVEHYIANTGITIREIQRELTSLTARADDDDRRPTMPYRRRRGQ